MVVKVQPTDIIVTGGNSDALDFDAPNETWIIDASVIVLSAGGNGVGGGNVADPNNSLINFGTIVSGNLAALSGAAGVLLKEGNCQVANEAGALIFGGNDGIHLNGHGIAVVTNFGTVNGVVGFGVADGPNSTSFTLVNHGSIFGGTAAVSAKSTNGNGHITNFGTLRGGAAGDGVSIDTAAGLTTVIDNEAHGVIKAGALGIDIAGGMVHVINHGTILRGIVDDAGLRDVVINTGKIAGSVMLGGGADLYSGALGGAVNVNGGDGNDLIIGGAGNDTLDGGTGNNTLTGGAGADRFVFDSTPDGTSISRITDFTHGVDRILLSLADFAGVGVAGTRLGAAGFHVGAAASSATQHIVYNPSNGFLYYDPDGAGGQSQVHFATVGAHLAIQHTDFIITA
jgi:Ca2+-binding RTX toxin-like protein